MADSGKLLGISREHLVASRLRAMAEQRLYLDKTPASFDQLERYLNESMNLHPENPETYLLMARALLLKSDLVGKSSNDCIKDCVAVLNLALKCDPHNTDARLMLAQMYINRGEYSLAEDYLKDIPPAIASSISLSLLADSFAGRKDYQRALEYYTQALKLQPREHGVRTRRGFCLTFLGEHREAILEGQKALLLKPGHPEAAALVKTAAGMAGKALRRSSKWIIADLMARLVDHDLKTELYQSPFESDPLTGFITDHSLKLWLDQARLGREIVAVTAFMRDLRALNLAEDKIKTNAYIRALANALRMTLKSAIVLARPAADKLTAIISHAALNQRLDVLRKRVARLSNYSPIALGVGVDASLVTAMGNSIVAALLASRNGGFKILGE